MLVENKQGYLRAEPRISIPRIRARKGGEPLSVLTAYTTPMACALDPHVDILLVGDSLGMVLHGLDSTVAVTLEMMELHTAAVRRGSERAAIVTDLPFGSYQVSPADAFRAATRLLVAGAQAVKLEGGVEMAETIAFLTAPGCSRDGPRRAAAPVREHARRL